MLDRTGASRFARLVVAVCSAAACIVPASPDARACGGCFVQQPPVRRRPPESTVVTGHRMALSLSPSQTVLWDQIQYAGDPEDFAWVLPVKPGAYVEVSNDAWFEALDAATQVRVLAPALQCASGGGGPMGGFRGCACGGSDEAAGSAPMAAPGGAGSNETPPVTVVHEGTAGPYETVTVHANEPGALASWLGDHGYAIDEPAQPIIDAYASEGFDFIALRLSPNQGIRQMKPVRVVSPGASTTLPLRMVAAGTGSQVALTLFVIAEGRWAPESFPNAEIAVTDVEWDFAQSGSNYATLRSAALAANGFETWLTSYAKRGTLLSPDQVPSPLGSTTVSYVSTQGGSSGTIAAAYIAQGYENGEQLAPSPPPDCIARLAAIASSNALVVEPCEPPGEDGEPPACGDPKPGEIDAREIACGTLDDVAVALVGMHPKDVHVTRLSADLPRAALAGDLLLAPAAEQTRVENWIVAPKAKNNTCPIVSPSEPQWSQARPARVPPARRADAGFLLAAAATGAALMVRRGGARAPRQVAGGGDRGCGRRP